MLPLWSFQHHQSGCSSFWCIVRITLYLTKRLAVLGAHEGLEITGGASCTMRVDRAGEYLCVGPFHFKFPHCNMLQLWHVHQKHPLHRWLHAYRRVDIDPPLNHRTHFRNICWLVVVFVVFATLHGLPMSCLCNFWVSNAFKGLTQAMMQPCILDSWTHLLNGWMNSSGLTCPVPSEPEECNPALLSPSKHRKNVYIQTYPKQSPNWNI